MERGRHRQGIRDNSRGETGLRVFGSLVAGSAVGRTRGRKSWGRAAAVLALCLMAGTAFAAVPDATINRIVELRVKIEEDRFLYRVNEIGNQAVQTRRQEAEGKIADLSKSIRKLPAAEQRQVQQRIDAQVKERVASLQPQWESRHRLYLEQQASNDRVRSPELEADVQRAVEPRRQMEIAKRRRDRGDALSEYDSAMERQAGNDYIRIRNKYVEKGPAYAERFDRAMDEAIKQVSTEPPARPRPPPSGPYVPPPSGQRSYDFTGVLQALGWGLVFVLFVFLVARRRKKPEPAPKSTVYGSAHFAPLEGDVAREDCLQQGVFFGKSCTPNFINMPLEGLGAPVCSTPEHHTLIVARTRTGKGTRVILPTLLRYAGSALVIDPKGENAAVSARTRRNQLDQTIQILNPWNELGATYKELGFGAATFNPLDILDRSDPNVVAIAQTLAGVICASHGNAKDKFWQGSAANVLTAVFLWLTDQPGEIKTLGRAREVVSLTREDFKKRFLIPMAASEAFSGAIREMAAPFIDLAAETYSGVMSNLSEATKFLSDPQIKAATAVSSFSIQDLALGQTTVYVVIPPERMDTQKTWLRLVIIAAMHVFKAARRRTGHRCLFLIDEFASLGRLDDLPRDIATMSGFGIDFALVVQGLDQLKDHYGDAQATILSNCAYKWFCNVNDLESAKHLSESLGKATVGTTSESTSASSGPHGGSNSHSKTYSETGRLLLTPDEVLNLGRDVAILLQPGKHPGYLRPVDYWDLPQAFQMLRQKRPGLYWSPPLAYDPNPYVRGSSGTGQGDGARQKGQSGASRASLDKMTDVRARSVLGVSAAAGREEIQAAYKRLMLKLHPDQGGSNYLAQEINAAKAFLLGD